MGSNGFTTDMMFNKYIAEKYPESFDDSISALVYSGSQS